MTFSRKEMQEIYIDLESNMTGESCDIYRAISGYEVSESYFVTDKGAYFHVVRGRTNGEETEAIVRIFDLNGNHLNTQRKGFESVCSFAISYPSLVNSSKFFCLSRRPQTIRSNSRSFEEYN